jgi:O-antigen/teichoic acid export membrane protein
VDFIEHTSSLKKKFFFKSFRRAIGGFLSIISLPLVTRSLGPEGYGVFNYLKLFFEQIIGFLDIGTTAFYPKLSRRPGDKNIIRFVVLYDGFLFIGSCLALIILFTTNQMSVILMTDSLFYAFSALFLVWLLLFNQKAITLMDAIGKTIISEISFLCQRILLTIGLFYLYKINNLNLFTYFTSQIFIFSIFLILIFYLAFKNFPNKGKTKSINNVAVEFKNYSSPLFIASLVGLLVQLIERWMLQFYSGSAAQGHYSLGFNLSAICMLLTGSLTPLLMREYAIAFENNDQNRIKSLFLKFVPFFYVLTSVFACFFSIHGDWLARIIGGERFSEASIPVMILGLAPIHQSYGQLSGSLMSATDRTREYGNISILQAILSLPLTFFLLSPKSYGGFNMGATGLAIKMVGLQFLISNIQLWYNTKQLEIGMTRFVIHQITVVILFILAAIGSKFLVANFLGTHIMALIISGAIFLFIITAIILIFPSLISMTRNELLGHIKRPSDFFKS